MVLLTLVILMGCHDTATKTDIGPVRTGAAFIFDTSRFADGCEPYIGLDPGNTGLMGTRYKPSPATLPIVQKFLASYRDSTTVRITVQFAETSNQVKIQCGWVSPTVPEIRVLSVSKR